MVMIQFGKKLGNLLLLSQAPPLCLLLHKHAFLMRQCCELSSATYK